MTRKVCMLRFMIVFFFAICLILGSCSQNKGVTSQAVGTATTTAKPTSMPTTTRKAESTIAETTSTTTTTAEKEADNNTEQTEQIEYIAEGIESNPVNETLDYEVIILEKAGRLHTLIYNYLNNETDKLMYKYGEICTNEEGIIIGAKIDSDEMSTYAEYKALFADSIYGDYFDYINTQSLSALFDIDGVLCGSVGQSGLLGTDETWYLGYDVENDKIIGHFAELRGLGEPEEKTAEYLNDENNYWFYDITVQKMDGEYVITDCREKTSGSNYDYFNEHGLYYNSGFADRNLITNEAVKPKNLAGKL